MDYLVVANLVLSVAILVVLLGPHLRYRAAPPASTAPEAATPGPYVPEALPRGCQWPEKFDEFDGVMERFVCRAHGESFFRRRD